jgi:ankyrin repeat protein
MGSVRGFSRTMAVAACAAFALAAPALAQFSDSYSFIKAVRDGDGTKTMEFLNKPGQPVLNARDSKTGETALHIVVRRHDNSWLLFLLSRGALTETKDNDGNTPLITAVQLSDPESVRALLQAGAKVNAINSGGETPIIIAVQRRDLPSIRLLIQNGADPKIADHVAGKNATEYATDDPRGAATLKVLADAKPKPTTTMGPTKPF